MEELTNIQILTLVQDCFCG